ncbi:MAG: ABC transporter substrate-binding protein, partial [Chloroflexota bacterium]|nr:ABC transporter substrate-binding protein [Chloroflexota bacterium]
MTLIVQQVAQGAGLNRAQAPDDLHYWGVGETFFMPVGTKFINPMLAESWEVSPDLKKVTMKLRKGVQFHKGWGEMTADDAAWSVNDANAYVTKDSIHGQAGDFAALFDKWNVVDKYTVEVPFRVFDVTWNSNYLNDAGQAVSVLSKKAYDEKGADWSRENIIATGPYQVTEWVRFDHAYLEAVENHWRKTPQVKNVRIIQVPEESSRVAMMLAGEADAGAIA